jgi:hypothetical protein
MNNNAKATTIGMTDERLAIIWDEYKYRHEHCWRTIYSLTYATMLLGTLPYLDNLNSINLGVWLIAAPFAAISLIVFAIFRMKVELDLLKQVKGLHRENQRNMYCFDFKDTSFISQFDTHIWIYLGLLLLVSVANIFLLAPKLFG